MRSRALAAGLTLLSAPAPAAVIEVPFGRGQVVTLERPAASLFVADPAIADVDVRSPTVFYVYGKAPGQTSLFALDRSNRPLASFGVSVVHDREAMLRALESTLPGNSFAATTAGDALILSGTVGTAAEADDAIRIAARFVPRADRAGIINRLAVATPTQVHLKVRVVEVDREIVRALGFNWDVAAQVGDISFGVATGNPTRALSGLLTRNGGVDNLFAAIDGGSVDATTVIDMLDREGLVTVLAEPNLTALSGAPASFLAGGEFPIPVPQEGNVTTIEYRRFGISLAFVATIADGGRIHLKVEPEVSQLSDVGALELNGFRVPAITTRRVSTAVDLGSGQSFAIAGLLSAREQQQLRKLAGIGDLPVIGPLVRSRRFQRDESELVVIVTPFLVKPVGPGVLATPMAEAKLK
jgi:pilus assembly protein CpaC